MSFATFEQSVELGRPLELYQFTLGTTNYRYTSADVDVIALDETWTSASISADAIRQTGEGVNDSLTLDVPSWVAPAQLFMTAPPTAPIQVTIYAKHHSGSDTLVAYTGEVVQVNFPMPGRARITCDSLMNSMRREGLRFAWQRACTNALYDPLTCKVSKASFKTDFRVLSISGFTIGLEMAFVRTAGYFNGGFMEWTHPIRGSEYIAVESYSLVSPVVTDGPNALAVLFGPPGELFEGARGSMYPGCDFTPTKCQTVFNNYANYGGHPDLPGRSPFDGNPFF